MNIISHDTPTKRILSALSETKYRKPRSERKKKINKYSINRNLTFNEYRE